MIAACPKCQTRYRVEPARLGADGARLRCSQCSAVFRVRLPGEPAAAPRAPEVAPAPSESPPPQPRAVEPARVAPDRSAQPPDTRATAPAPAARPAESEAPVFDRARLVLVAHPDPDACKAVAEALEREGLQVLVAHDGVEAILSVQRALPRAVVLDAALPKMFGFQVCELIKRNESLRVIQVCLVGAIHREDRYRRPPNEIYGADFYIESPALPGALLEWLERAGLALRRGSPALQPTEPAAGEIPFPAPAEPAAPPAARSEAPAVQARETSPPPAREPVPAAERRAAPAPQPAAAEARTSGAVLGRIGVADPLAAARAQAERLARIIVSDIVLYNEEKFGAAVRNGGVLEAMRDELAEGRALFRERVDPQVRDERDFLADELLRVARSRGGS